MARIVWRCGVKGPIMLDIVGTHQLGRTCCLSYKSMKYQLKMESFKWNKNDLKNSLIMMRNKYVRA
ncbi:hypothetical protein CLONEX_03697 [[Clostridium] nexile DSM 1787]|nr:hypothetical protein CLONEX_03697 [[Clostridium] nexile DSM 1787]